jgi:hypothetical protein
MTDYARVPHRHTPGWVPGDWPVTSFVNYFAKQSKDLTIFTAPNQHSLGHNDFGKLCRSQYLIAA